MKPRRVPKCKFPFLLAGLLIGLFLTLQFKSQIADVSSYPLDEYQFQLDLVQTFVDDQTELTDRLNELTVQVEEEEVRVSNLSSAVDSEYLQELKRTLGLTEVSGQGIEIVLEDQESIDRNEIQVDTSGMVHASDLRDMVNLLQTFPNSGIAINDQRIVSSTAISAAGNSILVNNFHLTPPFTIQMITDVPVLVLQKMTEETTLPDLADRVQNNGLTFKFKDSNDLTLPAYLSSYSTKFINISSE